jgi:hypothetical protein
VARALSLKSYTISLEKDDFYEHSLSPATIKRTWGVRAKWHMFFPGFKKIWIFSTDF